MFSWNTLSVISILFPLTAGLFLFKKLNNALRILFAFILFVCGLEMTTLVLVMHEINPHWLYHCYTLVEFSLLMLMFSFWADNAQTRKRTRLSIPIFAIVWLGCKFTIEEMSVLDNYTTSLESVLLVGAAIYTMFALNKDTRLVLSREPRFWISAAILIYFSGNLLNFAFANLLYDLSRQNLIPQLPIHSILNTVKNLLFAGGFLCLVPHLNFGGLLSSEH